jgi:uncharacterized membrane protein YphA (DoxX/SURF4 family)
VNGRLQHELRKTNCASLAPSPCRCDCSSASVGSALAEKLADPGWRDGSSLHVFLAGQIDDGQVSFSLYLALMRDVFMPGERLLDWTISIGQLLAGIALVTGTLTNAALLGGIFMNLNFMLAGRPDPSAFYLIIQSALLFTNAGATLGVDGWLSRHFRLDRRHPILGVAIARHRPCRTHLTLQRRCCLLVAASRSAVVVLDLRSVAISAPAAASRIQHWCLSSLP